MLALDRREGRLRLADNLIPRAIGEGVSLRTRPGAQQVIEGQIARAVAWGSHIVFERDGRLLAWIGAQTFDLAPAGTTLSAATYQAPIGNAQREDRLFIADGVNPLWHITPTAPTPHFVRNEIVQPSGRPYPLEPARSVATWRDRLWYTWGTNRAAHSDVRNPSAFDPLWTVEAQGADVQQVVALVAERDRLLLGCRDETFAVTGDSQYNFQTRPLLAFGLAGPRAFDRLTGDSSLLVAPQGVYSSASGASLDEDLRPLLAARQYGAEVAVDLGRRLALVYLSGRVFVASLDAPGLWGELAVNASGLLRLDSTVGWYGPDGVWMLARDGAPDRRADGAETEVAAAWETWWTIPPTDDLTGRSLLEHAELVVRASRGTLVYTASSPHASCAAPRDLATDGRATWGDFPGAPHQWPDRAHTLEFTPNLDGEAFVHRLDITGAIEVLSFSPSYR